MSTVGGMTFRVLSADLEGMWPGQPSKVHRVGPLVKIGQAVIQHDVVFVREILDVGTQGDFNHLENIREKPKNPSWPVIIAAEW